MTSRSNVPNVEFKKEGLTVPEVRDVLTGVLKDFRDAFGQNLNIENPATPQGVLAADLTENITALQAKIAFLVAQMDPAVNEGRYQDAIGRIYFLRRKEATPTTVEATLTGAKGTLIPAGSLAQTLDGVLYVSIGEATIGANGTVKAMFQSTENGAVALPIGSLTRIYKAIPGWDAITNETPGVAGQETESREAFEERRKLSVAANASGTPEAVFGAVASLENVTDCFVTDNRKMIPIAVGATSYSIIPKSIYVAAVGGTDQEVANAIWARIDEGCDFNGNTTVTVEDRASYNAPYPTYTVKFMRPSALPIKFKVTIAKNDDMPADITEQIKQAIINKFTGKTDGARERISKTIYASQYYKPVVTLSDFLNVLSIEIGTSTPNAVKVDVGIDQVPTIDGSNIEVIVK